MTWTLIFIAYWFSGIVLGTSLWLADGNRIDLAFVLTAIICGPITPVLYFFDVLMGGGPDVS